MMSTPNYDDLVHLDRLAPALVAATGDDRWANPHVDLVSGGKSNLTFLLSSEAGELILRRPPTGTLLTSAHDMGRESRIQRSLENSNVPVARIIMSDQGGLIDVPCYVMEKVEGYVIRDTVPSGYAESLSDRQRMTQAFVDTLAALHSVDPEAVGLGDYGRPDGFMARQIRRWTTQWEATWVDQVEEIDELGRLLADMVPSQTKAALVHGDFRLDNVVYASDDPGRIGAVLDWELSTVGDPLSDVGLLMLFWRQQGEPELPLVPGVTHLPGFPQRDDLLARYAATTGADLSDMDFYHAFAHFKFAVVAQGVQARATSGAMVGQDFGNLDHQIRELGQAGLALIG
jgi:aminoglycoside phosphotransferase (APT) family kinase protein